MSLSIRSLSAGDFLYENGSRVTYVASPHFSGTNPVNQTPRILVMHYTGGSSAASSVNWFANPNSKVSAHITIGRDGSLFQSVPLNRKAWHAGTSSYTKADGTSVSGLNSYSIGIELANAGACFQTAAGSWKNPLGVRVEPDNIIEAEHKNGPIWMGSAVGNMARPGWEIYPEAQLHAAHQVAAALVEHYGLQDIVGHDDIAPVRKSDPGPLFNTQGFRDAVFGMDFDADPTFAVRPGTPGGLAIRTGPSKTFDKVDEDNLAVGTVVELNEASGKWWHVTVKDTDGNDVMDGWVYSKYLIPA